MGKVVLASLLLLMSAHASSAASGLDPRASEDPVLAVFPHAVYKVADTGNQPLDSWFFSLSVSGDASITPYALTLEICSGKEVLESQQLGADALARMMQKGFAQEVFDLPVVESRPRAWNVDRVEVHLDVDSPDGVVSLSSTVHLTEYAQKTRLIFPFRGQGLVTQGPFNDRGHTGPSNHFAIDVIGLTEMYAPEIGDDETNEGYAGWKRPVLAPADGVVVRARDDIPNNPRPGASLDPAVLAALPNPEPNFTIPGNHVVIDHGNSEFSVLMHLDFDSVPIKVGDRVKQGDVIGRLGNSGDSFAPHLHYTLMAGAELFVADPLPFAFSNLPGKRLVRGTYFNAK